VGDEHAYWVWRAASLAHPDGRAVGGEWCVKCRNAIPPNTHWTHRDRHVCSSRCNGNLKRQWKRLIDKAIEGLLASWNGGNLNECPEPAPNPRKSGPRNFATLKDSPEGTVPYEWEAYCPLAGDTVERHGVTTSYQVLWGDPNADDPRDRHQYVAIAPTGHVHVWSANDVGEAGGLQLGPFTPDGEPMDFYSALFWWNGLPLRWYREPSEISGPTAANTRGWRHSPVSRPSETSTETCTAGDPRRVPSGRRCTESDRNA
jgi:hypothetical protein